MYLRSIRRCTDPLYLEYDQEANIDDESCVTLIVEAALI